MTHTETPSKAELEAEAAFDQHVVETWGWTKFASMQTAGHGAEYGRAFKAGYLAAQAQPGARDDLLKALEPFARVGRYMCQTPHERTAYVSYTAVEADGINSRGSASLTVADFRIAAAVAKAAGGAA